MSSVIYVIIMMTLWVINLLNSTGLGQEYHTTERARIIVYIITVIVVAVKYSHNRDTGVSNREFFIFGGMATYFVFESLLRNYGLIGLDYLWSFCLIYLLSHLCVNEVALKTVGIGYATGGLVILYIFSFGSSLSGWNPNSIAMIALHSFLFFVIPFYNIGGIKGRITIAVMALVYIWLINKTDSRSCMLFIAIGTLSALSFVPFRWFTATKKRLVFLLLVPLFVAVFVVLICKAPFVNELNHWSMEQFKKPFFNGRDMLWEKAFTNLFNNPLFGEGFIGNFRHNCDVECLASYGIIGFCLWFSALVNVLEKGRRFLEESSEKDNILVGCFVSFIILFLHQSIEQGLFASNPYILPYMMIGVMYGRIRVLRSQTKTDSESTKKI